jgi:Dullard-like phosphatase family protein
VVYLLVCALRQIFTKKKKFVRCSSGFLNQNTERITLFIDLDNTLIFSSLNKLDNIKTKNFAFIDNKYYVYKRPHLDDFLNTISQFCDVSIYTASVKEYADKIIDYIDKNKVIANRYYRHDCVYINNTWCKDVSKFVAEMSRLIIIDDTPECHLKFKSIIINNDR